MRSPTADPPEAKTEVHGKKPLTALADDLVDRFGQFPQAA